MHVSVCSLVYHHSHSRGEVSAIDASLISSLSPCIVEAYRHRALVMILQSLCVDLLRYIRICHRISPREILRPPRYHASLRVDLTLLISIIRWWCVWWLVSAVTWLHVLQIPLRLLITVLLWASLRVAAWWVISLAALAESRVPAWVRLLLHQHPLRATIVVVIEYVLRQLSLVTAHSWRLLT